MPLQAADLVGQRGRALPGLAHKRPLHRENHHGAGGAGFSRFEEAPDSYCSLSRGESTSGISSASMSLLPEVPPSSTPGVPPKSSPSESRLMPLPPSESISSRAASSCSSVAGRMYADAGTLSEG